MINNKQLLKKITTVSYDEPSFCKKVILTYWFHAKALNKMSDDDMFENVTLAQDDEVIKNHV